MRINRIGVVIMQFSEKRIAEIFDYSRFEPSDAMREIASCFAEKYNLAQKNIREKVTFDEFSGQKAAKVTKPPAKDSFSRSSEKKNDKKL